MQLKYLDAKVVFQEVPDEVSLAIRISGCPNRCVGCHSPEQAEDTGTLLTIDTLTDLLSRIGKFTSCVCFMGGDGSPEQLLELTSFLQQRGLKVAVYSGQAKSPLLWESSLDYLKLGPYIESKGGLDKRTTNQRFYRKTPEGWSDITYKFRR